MMSRSLEMYLRRLKMLGGLLVHAAYATEGVVDREDFGVTGALIQQEAEKALETLDGCEPIAKEPREPVDPRTRSWTQSASHRTRICVGNYQTQNMNQATTEGVQK